MSTLLNGSICLTDLIAQAKAGHSAFTKAKNGKIYFNFLQWVNEEPDQYKNHSSLLLNSTKDMRDAEGKVYIGNAKKSEYTPEPVSDDDRNALDVDLSNVQSRPEIGAPDDDDIPF